jgi:hypothetical protein
MNTFFSFDLVIVYIPECKQQLKTIKQSTQIQDIAHFKYLGCSFITLREPCNKQRPKCDIAWFRVTNHLYHGFSW